MRLHAFVAMPFGVKLGFDGSEIDFNRVYDELIRPALQDAGLAPFRADEERRGGDIRVDMFQELLLADLVIVDLTVDNPNVWYELGVRHALRARGVVLIQSARPYQPFDIYTDRKLRYRLKDGAPDPAFVAEDRAALTEMIGATLGASPERKVSPVYALLEYLQEPNWKSLRVGAAKPFWDAHETWTQRITRARRHKRPADILVLADEAPTSALRVEACMRAGAELRALEQFKYALEQYERALAIDPSHIESRRFKGLLLGKLGRLEEAQDWFEAMLRDDPCDAEACAYAGRIEKDFWVKTWRTPGAEAAVMRTEAAYEDAYLRQAIDWYGRGFRARPSHYYSGVNAVGLMRLYHHLTGDERYERERAVMEGGVQWAVQSALGIDQRDFYAAATLGDLAVFRGDRAAAERAYRDAIAVNDKDWSALNSVRDQLALLRDLEFQPAVVAAALAVFERAMRKIDGPQRAWTPRCVFLFSGHMIDAQDRSTPRFPADKQEIAATAIAAALDKLGAGPEDLGLCSGACGGDLLFAEVLLLRKGRLEIRIPYDEPRFLAESVTFDKSPQNVPDDWRERFYAVKANANTRVLRMPEELGPTPAGTNGYERLNLWQLYTALSYGEDKVHFICLWNRQGGDGPGGTKHMHDEVARRTGQVQVLDTTKLW
jgi:tetratricopeptide (TPR) repeat protein